MTEILEYDHRVFDQKQADADAALLVRFYPLAVPNDAKSVEAGRPIFDDVEMIEIRVRGTKDNVVIRPIRPDDKQRFRGAYAAYKDSHKELESGTPLSQWPILPLSQVEELRYLGFTTIEHIANANDGIVSKIMGLQSLKNKAKAFLEYSKNTAPLEQLHAQVAERDNMLATMQEQIKQLQASLAAREAADKSEASAKVAVPARK